MNKEMQQSIIKMDKFFERLEQLKREIDHVHVCTTIGCSWNKDSPDWKGSLTEINTKK